MNKLRSIQLCELEMLKEVDRICQKYNIKYNLAYGSFLGAVRHGGFIPWDDDLDINMPLKDFLFFEKICSKELDKRFFLQTPKTDVAPFPFYKIRANNTLMIEEGLRDLEMHHGIWLDIFPYTYAAKNRLGKIVQIHCLTNLNRIRARYYFENSKSFFRRFVCKLPKGFYNFVDDMLLHIIDIIGSKKSGLYFELSRCKTIDDNFFSIDLLNKTSDYMFEKRVFKGPEKEKEYLTKCYGKNYMTPVRYSHIKNLDGVIVDEFI